MSCRCGCVDVLYATVSSVFTCCSAPFFSESWKLLFADVFQMLLFLLLSLYSFSLFDSDQKSYPSSANAPLADLRSGNRQAPYRYTKVDERWTTDGNDPSTQETNYITVQPRRPDCIGSYSYLSHWNQTLYHSSSLSIETLIRNKAWKFSVTVTAEAIHYNGVCRRWSICKVCCLNMFVQMMKWQFHHVRWSSSRSFAHLWNVSIWTTGTLHA